MRGFASKVTVTACAAVSGFLKWLRSHAFGFLGCHVFPPTWRVSVPWKFTFYSKDQVYFVHPSTDILVDISTDSWPMYWPMYRPIYRLSINISTNTRPIYRLRYVGWHIDRYIGRGISQVSVDILSDYRPICRSLSVGRISVDCLWYISQLCAFHAFLFSLKNFWLYVRIIQQLSSKTPKLNTAKYTKFSWQEITK